MFYEKTHSGSDSVNASISRYLSDRFYSLIFYRFPRSFLPLLSSTHIWILSTYLPTASPSNHLSPGNYNAAKPTEEPETVTQQSPTHSDRFSTLPGLQFLSVSCDNTSLFASLNPTGCIQNGRKQEVMSNGKRRNGPVCFQCGGLCSLVFRVSVFSPGGEG